MYVYDYGGVHETTLRTTNHIKMVNANCLEYTLYVFYPGESEIKLCLL